MSAASRSIGLKEYENSLSIDRTHRYSKLKYLTRIIYNYLQNHMITVRSGEFEEVVDQ